MKRWLWLLLIPLALGLARLRFDVEVLNLLPAEHPVVQGLKLFQQHFAGAEELVVTLEADSAEAAGASARSLAERLRSKTNLVASAMWQSPWHEHPEQAAELAAAVWLNQPPETFAALAARLTGTNVQATLADARERLAVSFSPGEVAQLSFDPYGFTRLPLPDAGTAGFGPGQDFFSSADGKFRLVTVKARTPLPGYRECRDWLAAMRAEIADWQRARSGQEKLDFTGRTVFVAEISSGMERDMKESVVLTAAVIAALFCLAHRCWRPMLWLLALLALILAATLALGGLFFGAINVVSLGFAAILLGLAVDYGVVHYQEAMASPDATVPEIRRAISPSIFWAAVTTISAFLVLNLGGLPGLAQLGSLVALGVALSALVMLFLFLPPLFRHRQKRREERIAAGLWPPQAREQAAAPPPALSAARRKLVFAVSALLLAGAAVVLSFGLPQLDRSPDPLRPKGSMAYATLDEIKRRLGPAREPLWLLASGRDEGEVARRLDRAEAVLARAKSNQAISGYLLPTMLWPHPEHQSQNRATAARLMAERERLASAALAGGFNTNSVMLANTLFDTWGTALARTNVFWPTNDMSRWVLGKMAARTDEGWLAAGFVFPGDAPRAAADPVPVWAGEIAAAGCIVSGWELLGNALLHGVADRLWLVVAPMVVLVLLSLWLAFRRPLEIVLSLAVLAFSGLCLLAVMRAAGWSWNLLNLMALPLMLGTGVDYSIFMLLALRRHHGDLAGAHQAVGRALLLSGGTAVAGFGSLALSSNAGMASLGAVCAVGIGWNMLISVFLLPVWWRVVHHETAAAPAKPSSLYGGLGWRLGLLAARVLPGSVTEKLSRAAAFAYWHAQSQRREVVIQNLLPLHDGDRAAATRAARALFNNFTHKLADLWRFESGAPVMASFNQLAGWERFEAAHARGRGVLIVTLHLGNWELGGPILTHKGHRLLALSNPEPDARLTELRQAARARWGVGTLIVGNDPFAFVEVIKQLGASGSVALLLDRPAEKSAVEVELFGRSFTASIAAAELARASGCAVLPVVIVRHGDGYAAQILPETTYDRAALGDREQRRAFTREILRAFEPWLRQHPDQWYHFVPIWPDAR
jgi:predicted RND superfamily exporter protein/lauroyl/myristoyl acyltransferase